MATVRLIDNPLKKTLSLKLINCSSLVSTLQKYMTASRVLDMLEKYPHQIGFVTPDSWYDPYETKFLNTDYTKLGGYKQPKIYCFCARMDNRNEEASWKIYKKDNEPLLRLSIQTIDFLSSLENFAKDNDCDLYFSKVDYRLQKAEIDVLYKPSSPYFHEFFDGFNDEKYVKVMSLKRWAFNYENEYRIFIIPRNQKTIKRHLINGILFVPFPVDMIKRFTFYPAPKTKGTLLSQIETEKYAAEYKYIRGRIIRSYPKAKVFKSTLYSKVKNIEKIEI